MMAPSTPPVTDVRPNGIPDKLKGWDQWVCWRLKKSGDDWKKPPIDVHKGTFASSTDPDTWASFEDAFEYHCCDDTDTDGLGFVFDGNMVGVDWDDCRDPDHPHGSIPDLVKREINTLGSYPEISPSKTGYHTIVVGALPEDYDGNKADLPCDPVLKGETPHIEIYDKSSPRYFTVTGNHVDGTSESVEERSDVIADIHAEYIADDDSNPQKSLVNATETNHTNPKATTSEEESAHETPETAENRAEDDDKADEGDQIKSSGQDTLPIPLTDGELIEKAKNAKNGDYFADLWEGRWERHTVRWESDTHSEADLALCGMLAFWTRKDPDRMDRLFRQSELCRDKWVDRKDYRDRTIKKAISGCSTVYEGKSETIDLFPDQEFQASADGGRLTVSDPTVASVVEALHDLGTAGTSEIVEHSAVDRGIQQVRRAINELEEVGYVSWERSGRNVSYTLTNNE